MRRLAFDPELRAAIGRAGRRYWEREHTIERMADDYEEAMNRALTLPAPTPDLPRHLLPDSLAHTETIAAAFAVHPLAR